MKSRMIRVHEEFDEYLERLSIDLSNQFGHPISKTEASKILVDEQRKRRREIEVSPFHV